MVKAKKKRFYVETKCLKASINFFMNWSFDELNNWLKTNKYSELSEEWRNNCVGLYFVQEHNNQFIYAIWIPEFSLCRKSIATLVHELHHVVEAQSEEKGFECGETKAYMIEYYLDEVLKKYKFN